MSGTIGSAHGRGVWIERALTYFDDYKLLSRGQRAAFIAKVSEEIGQSKNNTWRQFAALQYLSGKGVDLRELAGKPLALMSIEAVARIGRIEPARESTLFREMLEGHGTIEHFRKEVEKAERERQSNVRAGDNVANMKLSFLLEKYVARHDCWPNSRFQIQFPVSGPLWPLVVVDHLYGHGYDDSHQERRQARIRTVFFRVDHAAPIALAPQFQALIEGKVLRSLVTCDQVIVCTNMALSELDKTIRQMRPEIAVRLVIEHCDVEVDIGRPEGEDRSNQFESYRDYVDNYSKVTHA